MVKKTGEDELLKRAFYHLRAALSLTRGPSRGSILRSLIETAVVVLKAEAGSLLLIDQEKEELIFEVATGERSEKLQQMRIPINRGFAGHVALTGQPIIARNLGADPRFLRELAEKINFIPQSLLCAPLIEYDNVIGVLEVINKKDEEGFTLQDMDILSAFCRLIAQVLSILRATDNLRAFLNYQLSAGESGEKEINESILAIADEDPSGRDSIAGLEIASIIGRILEDDPGSLQLLLAVIRAFENHMSQKKEGEEFGEKQGAEGFEPGFGIL